MSTESTGLRRAERLMGGGALVLLISLFGLKWFEASLELGSKNGLRIAGGNFDGWHAFTHSRWLWLATIVVALAAVWVRLTGRERAVSMPLGTIVTGLGGLSALAILFRVFHHPVAVPASKAHDVVRGVESLQVGIWVALAASAAITWGGALAMRAERARAGEDEDRASHDPRPGETGTPGEPTQPFSGLLAPSTHPGAGSDEPVRDDASPGTPPPGTAAQPDRTEQAEASTGAFGAGAPRAPGAS